MKIQLRSLRHHQTAGVVSLTLCMTLMLLVASIGPANATTVYRFRTVDANICGAQCNGGAWSALDAVQDEINAQGGADAVTLQEVCRSQMDRFFATRAGWYFAYSYFRDDSRCGAQVDMYDVIASPNPMTQYGGTGSNSYGKLLENDGSGNQYPLLCADVTVPGHSTDPVRVCTVHLSSSSTDSFGEDQTNTIHSDFHSAVGVIGAGQEFVLTGDFNATPGELAMSSIYRLKNSGSYGVAGDFYEVNQTDSSHYGLRDTNTTCGNAYCRSGVYTHKNQYAQYVSKFDYIFVSQNRASGGTVANEGVLSGRRAADQPYSDHGVIAGEADLQLN